MDVAIDVAIRQASRSVETHRHGAAAVVGRCVVAAGVNRTANPCGLRSVHAEMDALWKLPANGAPPDRVVVVRLRRDQPLGNSRPCAACMRALRRAGVRRVTYSTDDPARPFATEPV